MGNWKYCWCWENMFPRVGYLQGLKLEKSQGFSFSDIVYSFLKYLFILYEGELSLSLHLMCRLLKRPEDGVGSLGTRITGGCDLLHGCWVLISGPLQNQYTLSTTEPSLHPQHSLIKNLYVFYENMTYLTLKATTKQIPVSVDGE